MTPAEYERREFARVAEAMERDPNAVVVFGSNLAGRHGAGAAKVARERYGAVYGVGEGLRGRSYALPTKDEEMRTRNPTAVRISVDRFLSLARVARETAFVVTRVGTGLAGYDDRDIAPMFANAPRNCLLPIGWREINGEEDAHGRA